MRHRCAQPHICLMDRAEAGCAVTQALLDELWFGVVLIAGDGHVVSRNRAALSLIGDAVPAWLHDAISRTSRDQRDWAAVHDSLGRQLELRFIRSARGVAVCMFAAHADMELCPRTLERFYGLTPSESRVAAAFVHEVSMSRIAARLHLSTETVRTYMKKIFAKTGRTKQAELMRDIVTGPAAIGGLKTVLKRG
jgi:DNA-binding NarL/FixJ family response regulator